MVTKAVKKALKKGFDELGDNMAKQKKEKLREYTEEEVRKLFLDHCAGILEYWLKCDRAPSTREKMEGLLFSVFAAIDGAAMDLPAFMVVPMPDKTDKAFCKKEGENWFPYNDDSQVNCDIAGSLHDQWAKYMKAEPGEEDRPGSSGVDGHLADPPPACRSPRLPRTPQ